MPDEMDFPSGLLDIPLEQLNPVHREERYIADEPLPIIEEQPAEEPQPSAETPVDTTPEAPVAQEPVPAAEPTQTPQPAPQPLDWKEVLKQNGYDDFAIGALEYYKSTGDLTPYLEAKTVDYSALPDEEILRRDLRTRYKDLSDEDFQLLYDRKIAQQYNIGDMFSEEDQRLGRIEMKYAAKEVRDRLIEQQKNFRAPERQPEPDNSQVLQQQQQEWKSFVDSDPVTQNFLSNKRIVIGDGEQSLNFEIDNTAPLLEQTYDPQKFFASFVKEDGNVDLQRWYKVIAFANNMQNFEKSAINYGKTLGRKEFHDEIKNPPKPNVGTAPGSMTGNFKEDLLNEFLNSGTHRGR